MSDIKILTGESHDVKFKVNIEGTTIPVDEIRFTIWAGTLKVSFLGIYNLGMAMFKIQELERFMLPGIYDYFLEVFIINQCFVPFKGKIELSKPVGVNATPIEDAVVESVTIKSSLVQKSVVAEKVPEVEMVVEDKPLLEKEVKKSVYKPKQKIAYVVRI